MTEPASVRNAIRDLDMYRSMLKIAERNLKTALKQNLDEATITEDRRLVDVWKRNVTQAEQTLTQARRDTSQ